jgi:hypothetical protein
LLEDPCVWSYPRRLSRIGALAHEVGKAELEIRLNRGSNTPAGGLCPLPEVDIGEQKQVGVEFAVDRPDGNSPTTSCASEHLEPDI